MKSVDMEARRRNGPPGGVEAPGGFTLRMACRRHIDFTGKSNVAHSRHAPDVQARPAASPS